MSAEQPRPHDQFPTEGAPVLEYAGPAVRPPRRELPPAISAGIFGTIVTSACSLFGARSGPLLLTVPIGAIAAMAAYFIVVTSRQRTSKAAVVQLVVALALTICAIFVTFVRGSAERDGPSGLQYWLTYNPGYRYNPVWASNCLPSR